MLRRQAFEQHRRLPLVLHDIANPQQARRGIEIAPEAGGRRATKIPRQQGEQGTGIAFRPGFLPPGGNVMRQASTVQCRHRHAPGLARRTVAAGQAQWLQMTQALAIRTIKMQQLAAPRPAIRPEANTINRQTG